MTPAWAINPWMRFTSPTWAAACSSTRSAIASSLVDRLSLLPAAAETIENGPASGGSAVKNGLLAVASGYYDTVLVVGGEKMREVTGWRATDFVATMTHPQAEYPYGITLPGMAGMFTRLYMEKYGVTRETPAGRLPEEPGDGHAEPLRARRDGARPKTASSTARTPSSTTPSRPTRCTCTISARSATALRRWSSARWRWPRRSASRCVVIAGFGQATDTHTLAERDDPTDLKAVTLAAQQAFEHGQTQAIRYQRGRTARCLHHPGDRRERARRLLQEGRRRQGCRWPARPAWAGRSRSTFPAA